MRLRRPPHYSEAKSNKKKPNYNSAVKTIQRWARGALGRAKVRNMRLEGATNAVMLESLSGPKVFMIRTSKKPLKYNYMNLSTLKGIFNSTGQVKNPFTRANIKRNNVRIIRNPKVKKNVNAQNAKKWWNSLPRNRNGVVRNENKMRHALWRHFQQGMNNNLNISTLSNSNRQFLVNSGIMNENQITRLIQGMRTRRNSNSNNSRSNFSISDSTILNNFRNVNTSMYSNNGIRRYLDNSGIRDANRTERLLRQIRNREN